MQDFDGTTGGVKPYFIFSVLCIAFFCLAGFLLWWGETDSLQQISGLTYIKKNVVSIGCNDNKSLKRTVHMSCKALTKSYVADNDFGIRILGLVLKRKVEMYQWVEHRSNKSGSGSSSVYYQKEWKPNLESTYSSVYRNPGTMPYEEKSFIANRVEFGNRLLNNSLLSSAKSQMSLDLSPYKIPGTINLGEYLFIGRSPQSPEVGNLRISYTYIPNNINLSIISRENGKTFRPVPLPDGGEMELAYVGDFSSGELINQAKKEAETSNWVLRIVAFLFMCASMGLLAFLINSFSGNIQFFAFLSDYISFSWVVSVAFAFCLIIVAFAWAETNLFFAISLIVLGVLPVTFVFNNKTKELQTKVYQQKEEESETYSLS